MYFFCLAGQLYTEAPPLPLSLQTAYEAVNYIKRETNYVRVIPTGTRSASQGTAPQVPIYYWTGSMP
jgi:hypothetical protein